MADNVYGNVESIEALLPFKENGKLAMRNVAIIMFFQSSSEMDSTEAFETIVGKLKQAKEERSLESVFEVELVTFSVLAKEIYDLLDNAQCVCIKSSGKSAYYGDPSVIFGHGGGSSGGGGGNLEAVRSTLNSYASGNEPNTLHDFWESVAGLASDVAADL